MEPLDCDDDDADEPDGSPQAPPQPPYPRRNRAAPDRFGTYIRMTNSCRRGSNVTMNFELNHHYLCTLNSDHVGKLP